MTTKGRLFSKNIGYSGSTILAYELLCKTYQEAPAALPLSVINYSRSSNDDNVIITISKYIYTTPSNLDRVNFQIVNFKTNNTTAMSPLSNREF